jgi:hypothetical protein
MSTPRPKPTKPARTAKPAATYRGVRLQQTAGRTRFSTEQIRQAVEAAVAKHADALARRT